MPPLTPFSAAVIDERFRVKIAFDTNLLMYLLDTTYPKLNEFVIELANYKSFVDPITNKYALFELYEKRKETHFVKIAESLGYGEHRLNSDRFNVNDTLKYEGFLKLITLRKLFGNRLYNPLRRFCVRQWHNDILLGDNLFFENYNNITDSVKNDIPRILDDFGIETVGSLHDNLWAPTYELIFHSRISREDSLITMAFIRPEMIRNERNVTVLTNDGDFQSFYSEANSRGLIIPLFNQMNIPIPNVERITNIRGNYESTALYNLRSNSALNLSMQELVKGFVKRLIIQNNKNNFIGFTDGSIAPQSPNAIGIKVAGEGEYNANQNLLVIGSDLDFFYTVPYNIDEFRDHTSSAIHLPLKFDPAKSIDHNKVVFMHTQLAMNDPDKANENILVPALKKGNNLVFVHPDS